MQLPFFKARTGKARISVGLDIGFNSVKVVAVSGTPGRLGLLYASITSMERESEDPLPISVVRKIVSESVGRSGLELSDLRVSLAGKGAIVRLTDMPRMEMEELKSSIRYEAAMLLPFSLDDCIFDCHILEETGEDKARMKVVLAAAKKALVQERLDLLKEINLVPKVVSMDSIAISNAFEAAASASRPPATVEGQASQPSQGAAPGAAETQLGALPEIRPGDAVALLHIGAVRTVMNVHSAEGLALTRDIEVGGNGATLAIVRGLGLTFKEAERRKERGDPAVREFVAPMAMVLAREIRSTLGYVSSKMSMSVNRIYLSGGCALSRDLKETLAGEFGLEVQLFNPLRGIRFLHEVSAAPVKGREPILAVAAGLAISD